MLWRTESRGKPEGVSALCIVAHRNWDRAQAARSLKRRIDLGK